ncbi:MAG: hypothetical protein AAFW73_10160 [Bacteroidota bacterium]
MSLVLSDWKEDLRADFGRAITEKELPELLNNQERLFGRRFRPNGYVKVENTETNIMDPLKRAKISTGRGIWWRYTNTDNRGYFRASKKYRGRVRIRAKWRSRSATVRTSWNEMLGFWVSDHLMTLDRNNNGRTKEILHNSEHLWFKGTVHNGIIHYNDYCTANGINKLVIGANVWVWKNGQNGRVSTSKIHQVVFHESGHFSHAINASAHNWANIVAAEINNYITHGSPYHQGVNPTAADGEHIALAEGWATYLEFQVMIAVYGIYWDGARLTGTTARDYMENFDMYTVPMTLGRDKNSGWFLSGLFYDLTDDIPDHGNNHLLDGISGVQLNPIVDNVNGLNDGIVFRSLTNNIKSICQLKSRLSSQIGASPALNDLFESYGCEDVDACFLFSLLRTPDFPKPLYEEVTSKVPHYHQMRDGIMRSTPTGRRYIEQFYTLGELVQTGRVNLPLTAAKEIIAHVLNHRSKVDLLNQAEHNSNKVLYTATEAQEHLRFVKYLKEQGRGNATWNQIMDDILEDIDRYKGWPIGEIVETL